MKSMRMGKNRSWEPFTKGMTHGFMFEFKNQDDLDYYLTQDPMHKAFSQAAKDLMYTFITLKPPKCQSVKELLGFQRRLRSRRFVLSPSSLIPTRS